MADTLALLRACPLFALWLSAVAIGVGFLAFGAAFEINGHARDLIADARLALDRADCSIDFSSRCARMPQPKLSDQLRGVLPFTSMWKLFAADELYASEFEAEYLSLRAKRRGLLIVRGDLGALLTRLDELLDGHRPTMVKAVLPDCAIKKVTA